jgi:hypothetical protein
MNKIYKSFYKTAIHNGKVYCVVGQDAESKDKVVNLYIDTGVSVEMLALDDCQPCL